MHHIPMLTAFLVTLSTYCYVVTSSGQIHLPTSREATLTEGFVDGATIDGGSDLLGHPLCNRPDAPPVCRLA